MRPDLIVRRAPVLALALVLAGCPASDPPPTDPTNAALTITTEALPIGVIGESYSAGVDAEGGGGDYVWSLASGALPPGLALSVDDLPDTDALITGIPEQAGSFSFTLRVVSDDEQSRTRGYTIDVLDEPAPIGIETAVLPPALVGASYDTRLRGAGGDGSGFVWSLAGGALPPGLTLTPDGRLHGVPTAADTAILLIRVQSGDLAAERALTLQVVANRTSGFHVTAAPVVPVPAGLQPALDAAFARWQNVITGDVAQAAIPLNFFSGADCGGFGSILNGTSADDLIVLVNITAIDGPGRTLGQAGPCVIRANDLPFAGVLTLDAADLGEMTASEITDLMVHEIGHVLGFGSLWELRGLLTGSGTSDPRFTGASAVAQWNALGGSGDVPVENQGGEGTAGSHWRESVFNTELMTGFAEPSGFQPLTRVSIASLADLGYAVDLNAADVFALAPPMSAAAAAGDRAASRGYDIVLRDTIYRVHDDGSATLLTREPR